MAPPSLSTTETTWCTVLQAAAVNLQETKLTGAPRIHRRLGSRGTFCGARRAPRLERDVAKCDSRSASFEAVVAPSSSYNSVHESFVRKPDAWLIVQSFDTLATPLGKTPAQKQTVVVVVQHLRYVAAEGVSRIELL